MTESVNNLSGRNHYIPYLNRTVGTCFVDIHCHCLSGLDDGPSNQAQALELCRKLTEDGIHIAIATPHQLGRYEGCNNAAQVRQAVCDLNKILKENNVPITILPGGEVRVDERVCTLLETDQILTLADSGKYILLELPHNIFMDIDFLISELDSKGIKSVIAHAERIPHLPHKSEILNRWIENGALFQISASSLTGNAGLEYQRNAWHLLCSNSVSFIATDSHNTNSRQPEMAAAYQFIKENSGIKKANLLCIENPSRIINSQDIAPVSIRNEQEAEH